MAANSVKWLLLTLAYCLTINLPASMATTTSSPMRTYVIQMENSARPESFTDHLRWYSSTVNSVVAKPETVGDISIEEAAYDRIIYTYGTAFHGFAARLSEEEAEKLEEGHGVVALYPETVYQLHTTRSPSFLGLESENGNSVWADNLFDNDVVVGVLDTGIWPESPCFNDTGMAPVPKHWKGDCETGRGFTESNCNKKIVGARVFYRGYEAASGKINEQKELKSPRDQDGHGTHTAATVAGSPVRGANLLGYAGGTARGMALKARVAAYKVCWVDGCFSSDILSAIDQAVADGVNVLSISIGGGFSSYYRDSLSIAAFGAMEMGVFVSCSAGNRGPNPDTLTNVSPWITTVGASTMDRDFPATVQLGNGKTLSGVSVYKGQRNISINKQYQLVHHVSNSSSPDPTSLCLEGTLDPHAVAGKIVICDRGISPRVQKGQVVKNAGGVGMILANTAVNGEELVADSHLLPTVAVGENAGKFIKQYTVTDPHPTATLAFLGTKVGIKPSPVVAAFSSRGPNLLTPEILKPDLVAPGVNILAAWTGDEGPSGLPTDRRRVKFNILSGTSMSCPHVSGVAALLKARHPDWSPAAIRSALMTTAYVHDNTRNPIIDDSTGAPSSSFDHGAGHINPSRAVDPGLVFDMGVQDYFEFLCTQKLTPMQLKVFTKSSNRSCQHILGNPGDLNYPSISAVLPNQSSNAVLTLHRTATNVGTPISTYHAKVSRFTGASITVKPKILQFSSEYQKLSFKITFTAKSQQSKPEFGCLMWTDGVHRVRSPIVISWLEKL